MPVIIPWDLVKYNVSWNQKITHDPPYSLTVIQENPDYWGQWGSKASFLSFVSVFFSRAKNGGEGEGPRVSLWRPRRVGEPRPRYPEVVVLLRVWPTFGVVFAAKRSRRRRPRSFFSLSVLEMRNFGNRGFLLRQLAKSQSRKLRPESRRRDLQTRSSEAWEFHDHPGTFMINQTRKTAQLLCPMAMERWAGGRSGGLGRSSRRVGRKFPALSRGNPW